MTLIAGFRASQGGVLLCSDREEDDGISKRSVNKLYRPRDLRSCEVFITGAGPTAPIKNAVTEIHKSLKQHEDNGEDIVATHHAIIEASLKSIHRRYAKVLKSWPLSLIIVVAPRGNEYFPLLYHSDGEMLDPEARYVTHGSGKAVADYLASRLYSDDLQKKWLIVSAALIFREAGETSSGVGFGSDMVLIHNGGKQLQMFGHEAVRQIEQALPPLVECLHNCWTGVDDKLGFPDWLNK